MRSPHARTALALAVLIPVGLASFLQGRLPADDSAPSSAEPHRSPIALTLSSNGSRLLSANQTSDSVSLVDVESGKVLAEVKTGEKPAGVAIAPDGRRAAVTHWYGYDLAILEVGPESLKVVGRVEIGPEPRGVAIAKDGKTAYVALGVSNEVVRVDLDAAKVSGRLEVGREPRSLALSPDGAKLLVGNGRAGSLSLIDTAGWKVERTIPTNGVNLRQVAIDPEGKWGYVANMQNRGFATTRNNIDIGWVLGQRLTRVPLDGPTSFETISLDPQGKAAADAHGVAVSPDGVYLAVGLGGTHEVMIFRTDLKPLPWRTNGARDLIAPELLREDGRFRRVELGGRPTELAFAPDGKTLYVANYLGDCVQVVDAAEAELIRTIPLGGPEEMSLARRGEALFHDASRSFNQWYSCGTCHTDGGHTSGLDFDTMNDGWHDFSTAHTRSRKKVPTLRRVAHTGPWTWHGWQDSLESAMVESFTKSMQGPKPADEEVAAVVAYLETLDFPRNPYRNPDGSLTEAAQRGEQVFRSSKAACATCHGGPELTDGGIHDVGLNEGGDVYKGHNPPSLRGLYDKDPYLHDGRAATLREALTKGHTPEEVTGLGSLDEAELDDLLAYLKSL
jgi:YVTN family beta-propeller protein